MYNRGVGGMAAVDVAGTCHKCSRLLSLRCPNNNHTLSSGYSCASRITGTGKGGGYSSP